MQIVEIEESQKEIWNKFISDNSPEAFLQSWEWGEFQKNVGRKIWRLGIVEKVSGTKYQVSSINQEEISDEIIAVALIIKHILPFGRSYFYCPRGPVIKKFNPEYSGQSSKFKALEFLFDDIKKIAKEDGCMFLRIDPAMELNQESGIMNQNSPLERGKGCVLNDSELAKNISNTPSTPSQEGNTFPDPLSRGNFSCLPSSLSRANFKKSFAEVQPKDTLMLDLEKPEDELLREMKQKTRYNIKLAEKKGVKIVNQESGITNQNHFEKFWLLTEETSLRNGIISHYKEYYFKMLEVLEEKDVSSQNKLYSRIYAAEFENKIIAANIVLFFGDMAIYLHGASSSEYRNVMAPYLLQWRQILDAKKMGFKRYDFWGITIGNEKESWQGITKFKKGFGGYEKSYIGAHDLAFNNVEYGLYGAIKKIMLKKW